MTETQLKKEIAELKKQLEFLKAENNQLNLKYLDLEDKNDDLTQINKKILRDKNEEIEKLKAMSMELQLQNANLEKENFELRQQIELDESRTYGSHYSERPKMSEIPSRVNNPIFEVKAKSKSVSFQDQSAFQVQNEAITQQEEKPQNGIQQGQEEDSDLSEINQELQRKNSKLLMIVEKNNEVYNASHQILVELNLQISNLFNEKAQLSSQVAELEDVIEDQQQQIVLLIAENKELIERLDLNTNSAQKGNNITNSTQATVADFIQNLQQEETTEHIDWSNIKSKKCERQEHEKECQNDHIQNSMGKSINSQQAHSNGDYHNNHNKNGQYGNSVQDETFIMKSSVSHHSDEFTPQLGQQRQSQIENQILISALSMQIQELTQKLQILSQKLSEQEKFQQASQQENEESFQHLKKSNNEKEEQIERYSKQIQQMQEKINSLEEEMEVQKMEFDTTIDDLYSQYEQKLKQIGGNHDIPIEITQN